MTVLRGLLAFYNGQTQTGGYWGRVSKLERKKSGFVGKIATAPQPTINGSKTYAKTAIFPNKFEHRVSSIQCRVSEIFFKST